jgi:hypothetical protein
MKNERETKPFISNEYMNVISGKLIEWHSGSKRFAY